METAHRNAESFHGGNGDKIFHMDGKNCYRCGGNHDPNSCAFRNKECFYCKNTGHMAKMCRKKKFMGSKGKKDGKDGDSMKQVDTDVSEAEGAGKQGGSKGESSKGAIDEEWNWKCITFTDVKLGGKILFL